MNAVSEMVAAVLEGIALVKRSFSTGLQVKVAKTELFCIVWSDPSAQKPPELEAIGKVDWSGLSLLCGEVQTDPFPDGAVECGDAALLCQGDTSSERPGRKCWRPLADAVVPSCMDSFCQCVARALDSDCRLLDPVLMCKP